jgi:hypothetical protein
VTDPEPERVHPGTMVAPVEPDPQLSRKNLAWGFALFGIALLIAGGTVVVALVYNSVSSY